MSCTVRTKGKKCHVTDNILITIEPHICVSVGCAVVMPTNRA